MTIKLLMFNNLFVLFSDRKQQLKLQELHDKKINETYHKCPLIIYNLLLLDRKINRDQILDFDNNNLIDFYRKAKINLEKNKKYQLDLDEILNSNEDICNKINIFIKKKI